MVDLENGARRVRAAFRHGKLEISGSYDIPC